VSDFAFRMSSLDRKLAIGEMVSPADSGYDPEAYEYPDPLERPEAFIQQYLQDYNHEKRAKEENGEDCSELDHFNSCFMDFLHTCSDSELGEEDLPGTHEIISLLGSPKTNGISSFRMGENKTAIAPLLAAGGMLASRVLPMAGRLLPFAQKGLQAAKGGLGSALKGLGIASLIPGGGGGGGAVGGAAPVQTTDWDLKGPQPTYANNRYEMPYQHVEDNLMFQSATSPGPKKRNEDIETLRAQVIAALKAWADSGEAENRAEWWVYFSYAHEASTIAELQTILTAIPADYHNAVMTSPLPAGIAPEEGNSGLPDVTDPAEGSASIANQDETPSPVPIEGAGTPQKMPQGQGLIPGAMASHDELKIRPIFAQTEESLFEDYAEEDRPVLAKVAKYLESGAHEEQIVNELSPAFGLERTIWAIDQAQKVANSDPLVDPAVANLGVEWKTSNFSERNFIEVGNWIAENHPEVVSDRKEMGFATDPSSLGKDFLEEEGEWEFKELLDWARGIVQEEAGFPAKGEHVGQNEDEKINQQADSNLITPQQEKWAQDSSMLSRLMAEEERLTNLILEMQSEGAPIERISLIDKERKKVKDWIAEERSKQKSSSSEKSADYTAMPNTGAGMSNAGWNASPQNVGLPPNPLQLTELEKQQQEMAQLSQMYPNVPPEMAKKWLNAQQAPHPNSQSPISPAGQRANPAAAGLPSATTAKVAAWKDTKGNLLERGKIYKMTSPEYPVPDFVRVINNGPKKLDIHLSGSGVEVTLDEDKMRTSKYKFEPIKTSSLDKEAYYIDGYHAIISVHNPETGEYHTEVSPNDRNGHLDVLYDQALKNKSLAKANDQMTIGNLYNDHTVRGLYNPQTKHLIHLSHPAYKDELSEDERTNLKEFWSNAMEGAGLALSGYNVYGEEDKEDQKLEVPWEIQQRAMRLMREEDDPTRGHWLEDEPWQKGKTKEEIEYWNRAAKWKPINKTANLSTSQQRELIDEQGIARNLDRLNLEGTHYPELANFEQTATIEEDSYQLPTEDQDLFL
jgi:hypothetical protein